jgi:YtoQ family protein
VLEPITDHDKSNASGVRILGDEETPFWRDHKGAKLNAIRNRTLTRQADVVVAFFGGAYRQWNTAFDAGYAAALGKPLVIFHDPEFNHALKEIDASAHAVAESPEQVVAVLNYVIAGILN